MARVTGGCACSLASRAAAAARKLRAATSSSTKPTCRSRHGSASSRVVHGTAAVMHEALEVLAADESRTGFGFGGSVSDGDAETRIPEYFSAASP